MPFYNSISDPSNFVISFKDNTQQDFRVFARGYAQAASTLSEFLLKKNRFADYEAYPVVFLYRQAFELYLKGFIYQANLLSFFEKKNISWYRELDFHRLTPLATVVKKILKVRFPLEKDLMKLADKICIHAKEYEQIDQQSFSYRYPVDKKGKHITRKHQLVNLCALKSNMDEFLNELEVLDFGLDITTSHAQQIYEILEEAEAIIASEK